MGEEEKPVTDPMLSRGDYTEIVAHALGDCASAVPGVGAFVTATKNIALNIAAAKQRNRVTHVLIELTARIANVEKLLASQSCKDGFLVLFYRLLYQVRDEVRQDIIEAYVCFGKRLLTEDTPYDETLVALNKLAELSEYELKLLMVISRASDGKLISRMDFANDMGNQRIIGAKSCAEVQVVLVGLMRKGLISVTQYGAILGEVANDEFKNFRLSREGRVLSTLVG